MRYVKRNTAQNEMQYKNYRNKLNHILKIAEKKHYTDLLNNKKSNLKKTWKIMKGIINKNGSNSVNGKFKLQDGSLTTDKQLISERFNEFFVGIGPSLAKRYPLRMCPRVNLWMQKNCTLSTCQLYPQVK